MFGSFKGPNIGTNGLYKARRQTACQKLDTGVHSTVLSNYPFSFSSVSILSGHDLYHLLILLALLALLHVDGRRGGRHSRRLQILHRIL
jgi:hypothetical protein